MSRKGDEILAIYGYSRISTSNQDYKTQIQTLENAGAEIIFLENHWIIEQNRRNYRDIWSIRATAISKK
ncbi:hypothetical protein EfmAA818_30940 (plasmid) [Enterococcus faecium]|nr:hypothetical protein EfmAA818_30940 [Enterococcus faecium]